jgi:hypothetical protein
MCVIIVKPSGEEMPDETTLWQCWQVNPDGAGYMYQHNDKVVVSKGYMHLGDLEIALKEISHIVENTTLVIHFRLATHGKVNRANTHPFPVSTEDKELASLDIEAESALAHNGMLPNVWGKKALKKHSDSFMFCKTISHLPQGQALYDMLELIAQASHSRFVLLNGDLHLFGNWKEHDGCIYSNLNFLGYTKDVYEIVNPETGKTTVVTENDFYSDWDKLPSCPDCGADWLDDCYQFFYCSSCGIMIEYDDPRLDEYWEKFDDLTLPDDTPEESCQLALDLIERKDENAETTEMYLDETALEKIRKKFWR